MRQSWSQGENRKLAQMMGYIGSTYIPSVPVLFVITCLGLQSYYLSTGRYTPSHYKADVVSAHWTNELTPMLGVEHERLYCGDVSNLV